MHRTLAQSIRRTSFHADREGNSVGDRTRLAKLVAKATARLAELPATSAEAIELNAALLYTLNPAAAINAEAARLTAAGIAFAWNGTGWPVAVVVSRR